MTTRQHQAIVLEGDSGVGKSAFVALVAGLHYPNRNNKHNIDKFFNRFGWGYLDRTTFVGVNEGTLKKEHLPDLKLFLTNLTFDAERKHLHDFDAKNYNSLIISSDLADCLVEADESVKRRIFVPEITDVKMEDANFSKKEIMRIYNMDSFLDEAQAQMDTLAFAEYLHEFDDSDIEIKKGFENEFKAEENFTIS